jgi:hypothetical protein
MVALRRPKSASIDDESVLRVLENRALKIFNPPPIGGLRQPKGWWFEIYLGSQSIRHFGIAGRFRLTTKSGLLAAD